MNESINYEGVYRTAPATPGLLIKKLSRQKISKFLGKILESQINTVERLSSLLESIVLDYT